jgi:putative endonuclease
MYSVYVLRSLRHGKRYVGYTSKTPSERLAEHNSGANQYTRQNGPFELVYFEEFNDKKEALIRERFLKSGQGRKYLDSAIPG